MVTASEPLAHVRDLYDRGLYLQAWEASRSRGALRQWNGTSERILAGRLAANLGAARLGRVLHFRAWRLDRSRLEALYSYAYALLDRRGPLDAWNALRDGGDFSGAPEALRSDLFALRAEIAALLRDFDTAEHWLGRAEELTADRAWTHVIRSRVLEHQDRYPEALEAIRRALDQRPWYRPAVQAQGHLLQLLDRDPEALTFLREASRHLESGAVVIQLAALEIELGHHAEARLSCDRIEMLHPLMEDDLRTWLLARRCDTAYASGDLEDARRWALEIDTPFYRRFAQRLAPGSPDGGRVLLQVGFVRQHHLTCAPATLSAISRYWDMAAEHLSVAEEICYDGTPAHSERRWAEHNGWTAREFRVTWESARALLDRGIPFTFTTVEPASAHLQAMIGYDGRRSSFIVRDPFQRNFSEFLNPEVLDRYRASGPRGMLMVPRRKESSLEGIALPEADLYDYAYAIQQALDRHDRAEAWKAFEVLTRQAPGHRLTLHARRTLAAYDADRVTQLGCVEDLLKQFPGDANLLAEKLAHLRDLGRRQERLDLLESLCRRDDCPPLFWQQYARELAYDARRYGEAVPLLKRAIRSLGRDAESYHALAGIQWNLRRLEEAAELYRFAACLADRNERFAQSYFIAARHLRQTAAALLFLRNRLRRFGSRSGWPARTLFWAYEQLDRPREGLEVLEEALRARPEDPELLLFASEVYERYGPPQRAEEALQSAQGKTHRTAWLRAAARQAEARGRAPTALGLWREISAAEPLAMDAHVAQARLAAECEGRPAALAGLRQTIDRFPHHAGLHQLWIEWLRDDDPAIYEGAIRRLVEINPDDAWARRELALRLASTGQLPEAVEQAELACRLEPSPGSHYIRARVLAAAGKAGESKEAARDAIRLSVDADAAIYELVGACESIAERREALEFVRQELIRQVIFGEGLLTFRQMARDTLEAGELLAVLREALAARPDLWHAWSALVRQLADMNRVDEALEAANQATARFPLVPRLWVDLAHLHQLRGAGAQEREALEQAMRINPSWSTASRELAAAYEREGDFPKAREVMEQAVQRSPLEAHNLGGLAQMLWKLGEREAAIERLAQAVGIDPGYEWAWGRLRDWSGEMGRRELPLRLARELVGRRGGEARSWMILAQTLEGAGALDERIGALETASRLNPRLREARDLEAALLAGAGRFREALEACSRDGAPLILRGRAAWIEAQRGNRRAAIEKMQAIVKEDPSYFWGWLQLANWYTEAGARKELLEASRQLVRLAPQSELAAGYLADALVRSGDRQGALAEFRRSIELDPEYAFGAQSLLDLLLENRELEKAAAVLASARKHIGGPFFLSRQVLIDLKSGRLPAALEALGALCRDAAVDRPSLEAAVRGFAEAGASRQAQDALLGSATSDGARPAVGSVWVHGLVQQGRWDDCAAGLRRMSGRPEVWAEGASEYVKGLANARQSARLAGYLEAERERLRSPGTWAAVGAALRMTGRYSECARWMSDWSSRSDARPWVLLSLVECLRSLGRPDEALEIGRAALRQPADASYPRHRLWVSFEEVLRGDREGARTCLAEVDPKLLDRYYGCLRILLLAVADASAKELRAAAHARRPVRRERSLRLAYRQALSRIAREQGALRGAWTWIRLWR